MFDFILIVMGGFWNAVRGGLFGENTPNGWVLWALSCMACAVFKSAAWPLAIAIGVLAFCGKFAGHRYYYQVIGRTPPATKKDDYLDAFLPDDINDTARNTIAMCYIGTYRCGLMCIPFGAKGLVAAPVFGSLYGLAYLAGALLVKYDIVPEGKQIRSSEVIAGLVSAAMLVVLFNMEGLV